MRILSIDGGGIRGLIPAMVLAELERRAERPVAELFDLVAGTSTGGVLACGLARPADEGAGPEWSADELVGLYRSEGPRIFSRTLGRKLFSGFGVLDEKYDDTELRRALDRYLGGGRLSASLTRILVTAYDLETRTPFFFKSWRAVTEPGRDYRFADAARATAAAPTYFEPLRLQAPDGSAAFSLVDGGVFATNPSMCAYAEAIRLGLGPDPLVLSLGTGQLTRPIRHEEASAWGLAEWVRPVIDVVFDGVADTVTYQLDQLLGDDHVRLQVELTSANDDLDDASEQNLERLATHASELIARESATLDRLAERLTS